MELSKDRVLELFGHLASGTADEFFAKVADDVRWTIEGVHPVAGTYRSKEAFLTNAIARLNSIFEDGAKLAVDHAYVDGDTAIVEMHATSTRDKRGVPFENSYCWVCRFADDEIVEVRAYLDSATVAYFLNVNEVRHA